MKLVNPNETEDVPVLTLPGVVATKTNLTVFDSATDVQLNDAFRKIAQMEGSLAWWIGDLGIAMQERKRAILSAEALELRKQAEAIDGSGEGAAAKNKLLARAEHLENHGVIEYTAELCRAFGVSESHVKNSVSLARFYEPSKRLDGLTPHHHQVAIKAVGGLRGDVTKAGAWLTEAKEHDWKASDLRKRVNVSLATATPPTTPPASNPYEAMDEAEAWAKKHEPEPMDKAAAQELLSRWSSLDGYLRYLGNCTLSIYK